MFAEELGGSAARKRQEQARARRRQLKQKQQQQQKKAPLGGANGVAMSAAAPAPTAPGGGGTAGVEEGAAAAAASSAPPPAPAIGSAGPIGGAAASAGMKPAAVVAPTDPSAVAGDASASSSQPSAVAMALRQRKIRNQQKLRTAAAVSIQSAYRTHWSNARLRADEGDLFDKRTSDLTTLRALLGKAGKGDYAPPPATSSAMAAQVLFLAIRTPRRGRGGAPEGGEEGGGGESGSAGGDARAPPPPKAPSPKAAAATEFVVDGGSTSRLASLLEHALLPGLQSDDDELDPILPWLQSRSGTFRLRRLLRLCLATAAAPHTAVTDEVTMVVDRFLRVVLALPLGQDTRRARAPIAKFCRGAMIGSLGSEDGLDVLGAARALLLYDTGGAAPIPPDAEKLRERCVSTADQERAGRAFSLALDYVLTSSGDQGLRSRFVSDLLTVPLLTWKISPLLVSRLIAAPSTGASPSLMDLLHAFVRHNAAALSAGRITTLLTAKDVPLTVCPAPPVLCLLANLVQLGHICTTINGADLAKLNFEDAALYFNLLSTVIDVVPLGAFSSRQSAVEWVSLTGAHHMPIVLSSVVIDQCKALTLDSYVRQLFACAIDDEAIHTKHIIKMKNDKDLKHEKEMAEVGAASAASLAAKEAMVDRSKSFWQTSKWARKLSQSVTSFLSGDSSKPTAKASSPGPKGGGNLLNTSSISRHLAHGGGGHDKNATAAVLASQEGGSAGSAGVSASPRRAQAYTTSFLFALCRAYGAILSRWGGGGKDDIVGRATATKPSGKKDSGNTSGEAAAKADPCVVSLLNVICFSSSLVKTTWAIVQSDRRVVSDLYSVIDSEKRVSPIRSLRIRPVYDAASLDMSSADDGTTGAVVLFMFVTCLAHTLIITDDVEIHEMDRPLPQHQLRRCILLLKKLLYRACCADDAQSATDSPPSHMICESNHFGLALISGASKTMRDLYDRSSRRPLCVPKLWLVEDLLERDIRRCKKHQDYASLLSAPVLRLCPFLVSFKRRLKIFERLVTTDRIDIQGSNAEHNLKPGVVVRIMRGRVLEDGLIHLNNLGRNMRQRIVVQYISQAGATETGVDVGGLFKEFWTDLSNLAFNPNYALFRATEGSGDCLYPNPSSRAAHGSDHIILFEFLGRILGKALYEGITIQPQFAHFFLSFLRGDYNFLHMLPDLSTMDPQLYNNLMFLKTYEGDASDLCLTFTVANDDFGGNEEVPLIPNGANVEVTNSNKQRYIGLVAKYHVCDRVREQSEAFTRGLWEVIDRSWLRLFNEPELQVLISGASDGKIDVSDMKSNARYAGGYTGLDKHVYRFWNVVSSFNSKQQADLLRFVTSCERPPPLGFASMNPPFTIQRVGIMRDGDKLPSASTCFNTLKLPTYSSEKVLRERLLFAIQAGAGFELT